MSKPRGIRGKLTKEEEELLERLPSTPFLAKEVGENVYQVLRSLADRGIVVRVGTRDHRILWLLRYKKHRNQPEYPIPPGLNS